MQSANDNFDGTIKPLWYHDNIECYDFKRFSRYYAQPLGEFTTIVVLDFPPFNAELEH